jgi:hypothetical protein
MKTTGLLKVVSDFKLKDKVIIHPNDGVDLGLFNYSFKVKIISILIDEKESFDGELILENKCKTDTVELSTAFWQKLGKPDKIKLAISDDKTKLFISK